MTDAYNQGAINLLEGSPISVQTPDATALILQLGAIGDGGSLAVDVIGGGSNADPLLTNTNNYVILTGDAVFTRSAGVGIVTPAGGPITIFAIGFGPPVLTFTISDNPVTGLSECSLTIVGPPTPYNHRVKYTAIQF